MYKKVIDRPYIQPRFHLETNDIQLFKCLNVLYPSCDSDDGCTKDSYAIKIITSNDICHIYSGDIYSGDRDGDGAAHIPRDDVLQQLENIFYINSSTVPGISALHAASVGKGSKAFLFAGFTQTGKTTLTAFLCHNDFTYISDDVTLISQGSINVKKAHNPISLRPDSMEILKGYGIHIQNSTRVKWGHIDRCVYMPAVDNLDDCKIAGIFFIKRTQNINSIKRCDQGTAFQLLMKSFLYYKKHDLSSIKFIKELTEAGCYSLSYSNMEYVCEILTGMVHRYGT